MMTTVPSGKKLPGCVSGSITLKNQEKTMTQLRTPLTKLLLLFTALLTLTGSLSAATINVPGDSATIQGAIDGASNGDTVQVAAGTYTENINFNGKNISVIGAGPNLSIIDGDGSGSVVKCNSGETSTTVLGGFTITNGSATVGAGMYNYNSSPTVTNCTFSGNTADSGGGGMYNNSSRPTVTNCTFSGNSAPNDGGGMYNRSSSPTVINCTFSGNTAGAGGGMSNSSNSNPTVTNCTFSGNTGTSSSGGMFNYLNSSPTVTNCTFSGNSANNYGGGMFNFSSSPTVTNCTFSGNTSTYYGGGMANNSDSSPTVTNCTFSGNTAYFAGGGMFNYINSSPTVTNCTFSGNSANNSGGGMFNEQASPTVSNCILWGDSPDEIYTSGASTVTVSFSDVQGGLPGGIIDGGGNIAVDPLFVDADGPDNTIGTEDDNLLLSSGSPCIDSGSFFDFNSLFDLGGNYRYVDDPTTINTGSGVLTFLDMGAYEFQVSPCSILPGDINCDGIVNLLDQALLALHWLETN
jgi:parallel beta-helix repeat protein